MVQCRCDYLCVELNSISMKYYNVGCGLLLLLLVLMDTCVARTSESLRVTLPNGSKLIGRHLGSHDGNGIRSFMGIPYAEPPIGELRFSAPVPASPWQGERRVIKDGAICTQRNTFRRAEEIEGTEDCLYLNVFVSQNPDSKGLLPVMVFFHGGGFHCGSGISAFYGPDYLLDHDVVFVGANYRLGPLGFLSTGQEDCPGNNGLKDQVMVLKWIKENILAFGGDPERVTIFGESAGGASVTYHMMSSLSEGLFHRAISQSGTNLAPWARPAHETVAPKRAAQLALSQGCPKEGHDWKQVINCLRRADAANITRFFSEFFEWDTDPMVPFPPVVEPDLPGAFITKHPCDIKEPHGTSIPWMTGLTLDEGVLKSAPIINMPHLYKDLNERFDTALAIALYFDHHPEDIRNAIGRNITEFYFGGRRLSQETHQNLTNLFTDGWFLAGTDEYTRMRLANRNAGPTYVYLFAHRGQASFTEIYNGGPEEFYGIGHADELQFLFPMGNRLFVSAAPTEDDNYIRKAIVSMWVTFATDGEPTSVGSDLTQWKATNSYPLEYLRIGNNNKEDSPIIAMEIGLMEDRADFWQKLNAHSAASYSNKEELYINVAQQSCGVTVEQNFSIVFFLISIILFDFIFAD